MTEQTIEAPPLPGAAAPPRPAARALPPSSQLPARAGGLIRSHPWVFGGLLLLAMSTAIVRWAGVRPGYDPYGWLVWGHLTIHWALNTNGAPSWKPLPYVFTVPYNLFGHYAMWLWMITSVAISLSGVVFAWRIAFRLVAARPERRYAAYLAGLFAACAVLGIRDYTHFVLSAQSDPMIVALCLGAVDCWLSGRLRWAFWLWVLAALGRPEVWPFLGAYSLWFFIKHRDQWRVLIGLVVLPALWFGIPALTAKSAFVAGNIALHSPRELHNNKFFGTIDRYFDLHELPVQLLAGLAIVIAAFRRKLPRNQILLLLAAGTVVWVLVEAGFALHGWPAVPRYLFEPVAMTAVLAAVALGIVVHELPGLLSGALARFSPQRMSRFVPRAAAWTTGLLVLAVGLSMVPSARSRLHIERRDLTHERTRAVELNKLQVLVSRLGGSSRILACGQPNIPIGYQSTLAWDMGVNVGILYYAPNSQDYHLHPHPVVNMYPVTNGWKVSPGRVNFAKTPQQIAACNRLHLTLR